MNGLPMWSDDLRLADTMGGSMQREGKLAWKFGQSCLNQWTTGMRGWRSRRPCGEERCHRTD